MAVDLLSLTDTIDALGVTGDADAMVVQTYIAAASEKIAAMCGPVVETGDGSLDPLQECHDGGAESVTVDVTPVYNIVEVAEWDGTAYTPLTVGVALTSTTVPAVIVDRQTGRFTRRSGRWVDGRHTVRVQYWAGRVAVGDPVPSHFRQAAFMIVDRLWKLYQASGTATYGTDGWVPARAVPPMVDELLAHELLLPGIA